ncbi:hypothetical protein [Pseudoalteromonas denitrificans]|uniref:Uncharacterized protein n=1 Tax=Pseudoalteromonas denitrificans DSM 6059 TaxID=1123010 RepID=A0A1I1TFX2_9GAMM|nr:hypothetical protein [Pseudoalteromonas denitrificans]SFD57486.1 hypothetical protein SAMN02745724_04880 [Pseudoalteromonas denitrificans DSM 6059]
MKLKLNKKKLKNLSKDHQALPSDMTPQVGGGIYSRYACWTDQKQYCTKVSIFAYCA